MANNTFVSNFSEGTGGAPGCQYFWETPVIFNSIFYDNSAEDGNDIYYSGPGEVVISYSNIDTTNIIINGIGSWTGEGNMDDDPMFIDPANGDFHINNCQSPCVNAGIDYLEINGNIYYCPEKDMDNDSRPYENTMPDIGADETPCFETSINDKMGISSSNIFKCYPNPFQTKTLIEVNIHTPDYATLSVVDFAGKIIQPLASENLQTGNHTFEWHAEGLPAGIYFLRLETNGISETKKLLKLE